MKQIMFNLTNDGISRAVVANYYKAGSTDVLNTVKGGHLSIYSGIIVITDADNDKPDL